MSSRARVAFARYGEQTGGEDREGEEGLRVIYFYLEQDRQIWFLTMYGKDEAADLTSKEKQALKAAVDEEKRQRALRRALRGSKPMANTKKRAKKRSLFRELMSGVEAMREHREGRVTLRTHHVEPIALPTLKPGIVRETREALHMSRQVFAFKLGVNPRTLERWEQGRSKPNEQAAALIWLVRKYPDTLERLESLSASA